MAKKRKLPSLYAVGDPQGEHTGISLDSESLTLEEAMEEGDLRVQDGHPTVIYKLVPIKRGVLLETKWEDIPPKSTDGKRRK